MGSKKKVMKKGSDRQRAEYVLALSRKAKSEVQSLLKRNRTGTLNRVQLKTGLKEVKGQLKKMLGMIRGFL